MSATTSRCGERGRRVLRLLGAVLAGGLLAGPPAGAGEAVLCVRVVDRETGRELTDPQCALVDPVRRLVRATFPGGVYRGGVPPRAGDALLVYRRGYDLARLALAASGCEITARLRRARTCTIRLARGDHPPLPVQVVVRLPRAWRPSPIDDRYRALCRPGGRLEVAVPAGLRPFAVVDPEEQHCVWPRAFWLGAGDTRDVNVESPRLLAIRRDGDPPPVRVGGVRIYPDLLWTPPFPAARVDAWRAAVYTGGWLAGAFRAARDTLPVLPDAPFHFFAHLDGRPVYRYVSRGDDALDLRRPFTTKAVACRPVVDGRPVPPGTVLAPGRLDLYTLIELRSASVLLECCHRTGRGADWPEVRLPPSTWLTVWHEDHGLAHVAWEKGRRPEGRTYPGRLTVTVPEGFSATGYVAAYPTWKGTGEWRLAPKEEGLRRRLEGRRRVRFPGLRPGPYGLDIRAVLTEAATGRVVELHQMHEISLGEEQPWRVWRLSAAHR